LFVGLKRDAKVTQMQYYRVLLSQRLFIQANPKADLISPKVTEVPDKYHFTFGRSLLQEFYVDMFSRMQDENLSCLRRPAMQSRITSANSYAAATEMGDVTAGTRVGRSVLPRSTPGTHWKSNTLSQNALHVASELGQADFFITITVNARDPNILRHLLPGQTACDRPDVVARVFHLKMRVFIAKLKNGDFFGGYELLWYAFVIEWQKRSTLPHMHVAAKFRLPSPEVAFQFVSAELPVIDENSTEEDRQLHHIIATENIHRNDGVRCTYQSMGGGTPCLQPGKCFCQRGFPKMLCAFTHIGNRGYPNYRRTKAIDQFVVPYNRQLSLFLGTHCNVEVASFVTHILYMYKYFYKGAS